MYSPVNSIFHISVWINCNQIGEGLLHYDVRNWLNIYLNVNTMRTYLCHIVIWRWFKNHNQHHSFTSGDCKDYSPLGFKAFVKAWCFGGTYCLCLQGQRVGQAKNQQMQGGKRSFFALRVEVICSTEILVFSELHGIMTQKSVLFKVCSLTVTYICNCRFCDKAFLKCKYYHNCNLAVECWRSDSRTGLYFLEYRSWITMMLF
jgi:hypothetical protein